MKSLYNSPQCRISRNPELVYLQLMAPSLQLMGVMGDGDTRSVLLMSSLLHILVLVAVTAENLLHKGRMMGVEAGIAVLLWQPQDIPP